MTDAPERKPRYRRPPSWGIHDASGVRYPGGDGPTWWEDARPADPEAATTRPEPPPIFSEDCLA